MSTAGNRLAAKIIQDRLVDLIDMFRNLPMHDVRKTFVKVHGIGIDQKDIETLYKSWVSRRQYTDTYVVQKVFPNSNCWEKVLKKCEDQVNEEIAEWMYGIWKQHQKRKK